MYKSVIMTAMCNNAVSIYQSDRKLFKKKVKQKNINELN